MLNNAEIAHLETERRKDLMELTKGVYFPHVTKSIHGDTWSRCHACNKFFCVDDTEHIKEKNGWGERYYIKCPICGEEIEF